MSDKSLSLKKKDDEMKSFVEKRLSVAKASNLIEKTKSIQFNVLDDELDKLNESLENAKGKMNLVPNPEGKFAKWAMKKFPKATTWAMQAFTGKQFANAESLEKIEILINNMDDIFEKLKNNIKPTRELQEQVISEVETFQEEKDKIDAYLKENPDAPSKEFLQLHSDKLGGTIDVLKNSALVWLNNNIENRFKMYLTAVTERQQLETTLVAGVNTLKTTQEVKRAAETQRGMRDLTNNIQKMAAEANTEMELAVTDIVTSTIFNEETIGKIKSEHERVRKLVEETKKNNKESNERLRQNLLDFDALETSKISKDAANLIGYDENADKKSQK
jgi:hypothetical protein